MTHPAKLPAMDDVQKWLEARESVPTSLAALWERATPLERVNLLRELREQHPDMDWSEIDDSED